MGVFQSIGLAIQGNYTYILSSLPSWAQQFINLFLIVLLVFLYSIFFWKIHKFISRKNIIDLNLGKYNTSKHPIVSKFFGVIFYLLEYIIITPFVIFLWFSTFTIFITVLNGSLEIKNLLLLSTIIVGAIRIISYVPGYGKDLAENISMLFPLSVMIVYFSTPQVVSFEGIIGRLAEIPIVIDQVAVYLFFIVTLEIILRFFYTITHLNALEEEFPKKYSKEVDDD